MHTNRMRSARWIGEQRQLAPRGVGTNLRPTFATRLVSLLALITVLIGSSEVRAQAKTGTTVGQFLLIEPSARLAAMGNAGAATFGEVETGYYNPGAWGHLDRSDAQFTHSFWLADIAFEYAAVGIRVGPNGMAVVTLTSLNSGEIAVRTPQQPLGTGEKYSVSDIAIGVGYGFRLTDRFSAGLHLKYVQETIWHSSLTAFALDLGTLYRVSEDGFLIGASLSNFGTRARYSGSDLRIRFDSDPDVHGDNSNLPGEVYTEAYPLPILFRVGLAYPFVFGEDNRVVLVVDAFHPNDNTESVSFGGEWTYRNLISLRAGFQQLFKQYSEVGLTMGGGLEYELFGFPLHVDYAWADHGRLSDTQRITVGIRF